MRGGAALALTAGLSGRRARADAGLPAIKKGPFATSEPQTPSKDITTYNNFYEFGTDKGDPAANAHTLKTRPWTVKIEGLVKTPKTLDIDSIIKQNALEERIYRHRCVEGWSMVIPWIGFPLSALLKQ